MPVNRVTIAQIWGGIKTLSAQQCAQLILLVLVSQSPNREKLAKDLLAIVKT